MRLLLVAPLLAGCAMIGLGPPKPDPFPVLEVRGTRPPPSPGRVVLTASNIAILDKVQFTVGSAELLPVSFSLLDEVAKMMKDNPQIEQVQIEGHTDSTGPAAVNRKLSQQRAESVVKYLGGKGVGAKRMTAKGYGPDMPIADNETDGGREANRRVEFNIVKQGPKKTVVKDD